MDDLLDELRNIGCFSNGGARCTCVIGQEAADRLEAQAAEIRDLKMQAIADAVPLDEALSEIERLRGILKPLADTLWLQEEPASREDLPDDWAAYVEEMEAFSTHYIELARAALPVVTGGLGGVASIAAERRRQIVAEGWTSEHDDAHQDFQLAEAAACYALGTDQDHKGAVPVNWPWEASWWKPRDRRENLVRSGALIAAEIDRIDRLAAKLVQEG